MSSHTTYSNYAPCLNEDVTKHRKTETLTDSGIYTDSGDLDLRMLSQEGLVPCINGPALKTADSRHRII